ncbi:MAG: hypothetical protein ACFFE3_11300 [Candidatus Thorarchaeota archaeon]
MTGHSIEAILITDMNGNPRFYMQLDPRAFGMDPVLASSFFAAIDMFSKEVFQQSAPVFHVDYGAHIFTVVNGEATHMIAVGVQSLNTEIIAILNSLLSEFEEKWLLATDLLGIDASFSDVYLEPFGERVMEKLSFNELPDSWVPYFTVDPSTVVNTSGTLEPFINGSRNVKEILDVSGLAKRDLLLEISRMWAHRVIRFRNMLSFDDFVASKTPFLKYLQSTSRETEAMRSHYPEMVGIIPRLAGLMDGRRTVREMLVELGEAYDEREILRVLDHLLEREVIEALSPEKRRILLAKEVLEIALRVAEDCCQEGEATNALTSVMSRSDTPETLGQLRVTDNQWSVDFDLKMLEGLNNRRLMLLFGEWMKLLAQFAALLDSKKLDQFIINLTSAFIERIVNRFSPFDLRGFEEYPLWLEQLCSHRSSPVRRIKTGSLKPTGDNPFEEIVYTLVTRGQGIYGTERITRICAASRVPLMDIPPDFWTGWQKEESQQKFLIEYSKLGNAAKLTLLVLTRQRGLTLPKMIIF